MTEFIKNLIGKLEEEEKKEKDTIISLDEQQKERVFWYTQAINKCIKIVNQLSEEYKPNVNADIQEVIDNLEVYTAGRLNTSKVEISVLQLQRYINRLKQVAEECGKDTNVATNDSWIPCSEKTPLATGYYLVTIKGYNRAMYAWWINTERKWQYLNSQKEITEVIAWQPLPAPFEKKENNMAKCKKCQNIYNLSNKDDVIVGKWCPKINDSPDIERERECEHFKAMTNADKIRAMTDEELAEFLDDGVPNCADYCPDFKEGCAFGCKYKQDKDFLVLWLQSEAE